MDYQDLYNEYALLLRDKTEFINNISLLKDGYISTKTISGKKYAYLQYRIDGKLLSEYVKDDHLPEVRAKLDERVELLCRIHEIDERLKRIEVAAGILDKNLQRKLRILRRCAMMEVMAVEEREKSLAFGSAITALEGIPVSESTEHNLSRWTVGELSFQECYMNTLRKYRLAEV
jgi:hypothetical protein